MTSKAKDIANSEKRSVREQNLKTAQTFLAKVQAEVEQFGLIMDEADKSAWHSVIKKLEKEIPRNMCPKLRTIMKRGLANIAMQQDPQGVWKVLESIYISAQLAVQELD